MMLVQRTCVLLSIQYARSFYEKGFVAYTIDVKRDMLVANLLLMCAREPMRPFMCGTSLNMVASGKMNVINGI